MHKLSINIVEKNDYHSIYIYYEDDYILGIKNKHITHSMLYYAKNNNLKLLLEEY